MAGYVANSRIEACSRRNRAFSVWPSFGKLVPKNPVLGEGGSSAYAKDDHVDAPQDRVG